MGPFQKLVMMVRSSSYLEVDSLYLGVLLAVHLEQRDSAVVPGHLRFKFSSDLPRKIFETASPKRLGTNNLKL